MNRPGDFPSCAIPKFLWNLLRPTNLFFSVALCQGLHYYLLTRLQSAALSTNPQPSPLFSLFHTCIFFSSSLVVTRSFRFQGGEEQPHSNRKATGECQRCFLICFTNDYNNWEVSRGQEIAFPRRNLWSIWVQEKSTSVGMIIYIFIFNLEDWKKHTKAKCLALFCDYFHQCSLL